MLIGKGELNILEVGRKRQDLRNQVRKAMGLDSSDFLVISLSSINPGKGQLLMLQAALMVAEGIEDEGLKGLLRVESESLSEAGGSGKALRKLLEIHRSIIRLFGRLNTDNEVAEKEKPSMDNVKEEGSDVFEEPNTQGKQQSFRQNHMVHLEEFGSAHRTSVFGTMYLKRLYLKY